MLIDAGECGNCDAPIAIEERDGEEGYICLNCGYEHWEPSDGGAEDADITD